MTNQPPGRDEAAVEYIKTYIGPLGSAEEIHVRRIFLTGWDAGVAHEKKRAETELEELRLIVGWEAEGKIKKPRRDGRIWVSRTEFEALKRECIALAKIKALNGEAEARGAGK